MEAAVYNSDIPEPCLKPVTRSASSGPILPLAIFLVMTWAFVVPSQATDWSGFEQQLAKKIVAVTGPGSVALAFENRSSLGKRDADIVENGLRNSLEQTGIRPAESADRAAVNVTISLSENVTSYVWVANIRQSAGDAAVVMVAVPRPAGSLPTYDSMPLSLRKTLLWTQSGRILDVTVLEESQAVSRIAVLSAENVSIYRLQGGKWQQEQTLEIHHEKPWPRDLRGRLIPGKDRLLDVYLPGIACRSGAGGTLVLNCRNSEDPWPLVTVGMTPGSVFTTAGAAGIGSIPPMSAFFAPTRNFFTGVVTPAIGKGLSVPKFFSAAALPRGKYTLWLFSATDGQVHLVDGMRDQPSKFGWNSDIATLKTSCGAGWQVLATASSQAGGDSVRAYEMPDRDPIAVSAALDFLGTLSALWTEMNGDTAIAVVRDQETGNYEAFRLAVACNQ
jgi:hypothetical protein